MRHRSTAEFISENNKEKDISGQFRMAFSLKVCDTANMQTTILVKIFSGSEFDEIYVGKRY